MNDKPLDTAAQNPADALRSAWVLWGVLFGAVVFFALGACLFVAVQGPFLVDDAEVVSEPGSDPEAVGLSEGDFPVGTLRTVLGVIAIAIVGMAFVVPSMVRVPESSPPTDRAAPESAHSARIQRFFRRSMVGWALSEGAANLACITIFLVGLGPLVVTSLMLFAVHMVMTAPTAARIGEAVD